MKKSFLVETSSQFLVFGPLLYPTSTNMPSENYVARTTAGGSESLLYLLDPIPLAEIEANDAFSKKQEIVLT